MFAPHTNTDVQIAHLCGNPSPPPLLLGSFREADQRNLFEYAIRPDEGIDFAPDCPHIVYVQDGVRYARVLKTVAWIAVGENDDGSPIYEKWTLREHHQYPTDWVFKN